MLELDARPHGVVKIPAHHRSFINQVLADLESLDADKALKITISELPNSAVNALTLLHAATRNRGISIEMQADDDFLYVWKAV
jgi:hypothetical protein